jgi:hypothetical protein
VKIVNITMKVAVSYALPFGPNETYHYRPVPHGYAVAGVDEVRSAFEQLSLTTLRVKGICMSWEKPRRPPFYG